ncbi:SDR family oxidoreductase [Streptomyces sp. NPDC001388]|uniref:SDR family oxidoreductase n=1 Tax=Streptomyces sp. NPDC001388 TaxID=3364568 RepID=UPI0036C0DC5E
MAHRGAIVNTGSNSAYASMKGGLDVLTRYTAKEFSTRGIRVDAVSPGPTRTRIADDAFTRFPEVVPVLVARTALGRVGEPDDIGAVIATPVSDESRWVTAQNIEVSGGCNL